MIVAQPLRGRDPVLIAPHSRTMYNPVSAASIEHLRAEMENPRLEASRLRGLRGGLGGLDDVPPWAWWLVGGLAAGVAVGTGVYFMKR